MPHQLTRRNLSALAKLETTGLKHTQRLELMAQALGYANYASFIADLDENTALETPKTDTAPTPQRVIVAFGTEVVNAICNDEPLTDSHGEPCFGEVVDLTFPTGGEARAYLSGIAQAQGWERSIDILQGASTHPYLAACETNPDLKFEDWYAQDQARRAAEEAAYFDED